MSAEARVGESFSDSEIILFTLAHLLGAAVGGVIYVLVYIGCWLSAKAGKPVEGWS